MKSISPIARYLVVCCLPMLAGACSGGGGGAGDATPTDTPDAGDVAELAADETTPGDVQGDTADGPESADAPESQSFDTQEAVPDQPPPDFSEDPASTDGPEVPEIPAGTVSCSSQPIQFPSFDKTCSNVGECALVFHQINCCGTRVAWGIRQGEKGTFDEAEELCESQYPLCGCAQGPTMAEDGKTAEQESQIAVMCTNGGCKSYVAGKCEELTVAIAMKVTEASACKVKTDCVLQEVGPACGTMSCAQYAISKAATDEQKKELFELGEQALAAACPPFHCGCEPLGEALCLDGACALVDLAKACPALKTGFDALVNDPAHHACGGDGDCVATPMPMSPFCTKDCGCAVVTNNAAVKYLKAVVDNYTALGCASEPCPCTKCLKIPKCDGGLCK